MGRGLGLGFEGLGDDVFDLRVGDSAGRSGPRVVGESVETLGEEPAAPGADGGVADAECGGDGLVARFVGAGQDDAGAEGEALGTLGATGPRGELLAFVGGEDEFRFRACHTVSFSESVTAWGRERKVNHRTFDSGH